MQNSTEPTASKKSEIWDIVRFVLLAAAVVVPIRLFVAQPFIVSGSSMVPTFHNSDYLIVDELSYILGDPKRSDVAILRDPKDQNKFFIKRVVGLPNETVEIKDTEVFITNGEFPEGFKIKEPYIKVDWGNNMRFELKADEYFVMGDNRAASSDSRYWGAAHRNLLVGRAFLRLWPLNDLEFLPGEYNQKK